MDDGLTYTVAYRCEWCDRTWIQELKRGRPPRYCGVTCRKAAHDARVRAEAIPDGSWRKIQKENYILERARGRIQSGWSARKVPTKVS